MPGAGTHSRWDAVFSYDISHYTCINIVTPLHTHTRHTSDANFMELTCVALCVATAAAACARDLCRSSSFSMETNERAQGILHCVFCGTARCTHLFGMKFAHARATHTHRLHTNSHSTHVRVHQKHASDNFVIQITVCVCGVWISCVIRVVVIASTPRLAGWVFISGLKRLRVSLWSCDVTVNTLRLSLSGIN